MSSPPVLLILFQKTTRTTLKRCFLNSDGTDTTFTDGFPIWVNTFNRNLFTGLQLKSPADLVYNRKCNDGKKKYFETCRCLPSVHLVAINKPLLLLPDGMSVRGSERLLGSDPREPGWVPGEMNTICATSSHLHAQTLVYTTYNHIHTEHSPPCLCTGRRACGDAYGRV